MILHLSSVRCVLSKQDRQVHVRILLQLLQDLFRKFVVEFGKIVVEVSVQIVNERGFVLLDRLLNSKGV